MKILEVQPFSQRDPRWQNILLGFGTGTIGDYGCVLTSVTMMCKYFGKETTPAVLNESMKAVQGFSGTTKNLFNWSYVTKFYPDIIYKGNLNFETTPANIDLIKNQIDKRFPTVIKVEADEVGTPKGDHFLIVVGYDDNSKLWVIDPWDVNPHAFRLSERYSHNGSHEDQHIILGIRPYEFVGQFPDEQDSAPVTNKEQAVSEVFRGLTNQSPNTDELNKYVSKSLDWMVNDIITNDKRFYDFRVKPLIDERDKQWQKHLENKLQEQQKAYDIGLDLKEKDCKVRIENAINGYISKVDKWDLFFKAFANLFTKSNKNGTI
jgi:hypothetical protein